MAGRVQTLTVDVTAAAPAAAPGQAWTIGMQSVDTGGNAISHFNPSAPGSWDKVDGTATGIAVGPDGQPWVINMQGSIYNRAKGPDGKYVDGTWQAVPGQASAIAAGGPLQ